MLLNMWNFEYLLCNSICTWPQCFIFFNLQGDADIFFPTDFLLLEQMDHYCSGWMKQQKDDTSLKRGKKRRTLSVSPTLQLWETKVPLCIFCWYIFIHVKNCCSSVQQRSWKNLVSQQRRELKMDITLSWMTSRTPNFIWAFLHITSNRLFPFPLL